LTPRLHFVMIEQYEPSQAHEVNSDKPSPLESVILNHGLIDELAGTLNFPIFEIITTTYLPK